LPGGEVEFEERPDGILVRRGRREPGARGKEAVERLIIFAELSIDAEAIEALEEELPAHLYRRLALPYEAAFLACRAFLNCRRPGGRRRSPLPDFYIGAHAAVSRLTLLTRDARRYRTYFPTVALICPP
jgi:predicted nucleic acid-binding protein